MKRWRYALFRAVQGKYHPRSLEIRAAVLERDLLSAVVREAMEAGNEAEAAHLNHKAAPTCPSSCKLSAT